MSTTQPGYTISYNVCYNELGLGTDDSGIIANSGKQVCRRDQAIIHCFVAQLRLEIYNTSTDTVSKYIWKVLLFFFNLKVNLLLWYT